MLKRVSKRGLSPGIERVVCPVNLCRPATVMTCKLPAFSQLRF